MNDFKLTMPEEEFVFHIQPPPQKNDPEIKSCNLTKRRWRRPTWPRDPLVWLLEPSLGEWYLASPPFSTQLAYATGWYLTSYCFWDSTVPKPSNEASVSNTKGFSKAMKANTGAAIQCIWASIDRVTSWLFNLLPSLSRSSFRGLPMQRNERLQINPNCHHSGGLPELPEVSRSTTPCNCHRYIKKCLYHIQVFIMCL